MIPALLAQLGLPLLVRTISSVLETINSPLASAAVSSLKDVDSAISESRIAPEQVAEANRHLEKMAELESADFQLGIAETSKTTRGDASSEDAYVRRMRPTFGYVMALTWGTQMTALAYIIVTDPAEAGAVVSAMASLGTIWSVGLGVLGIYVYKRSDEKRQTAGGDCGTDTGIGGMVERLIGGKAATN